MSTNLERLTTQAIRCSQQLWAEEARGRIGNENENDQFQWHTVIMGYRWTGIMVSGCLNWGSTVGKLDWDHLATYPRIAVWARKVTAWTPTQNFPKPHHNRPGRVTMLLFIHHFTHRLTEHSGSEREPGVEKCLVPQKVRAGPPWNLSAPDNQLQEITTMYWLIRYILSISVDRNANFNSSLASLFATQKQKYSLCQISWYSVNKPLFYCCFHRLSWNRTAIKLTDNGFLWCILYALW